MSKLRAFRFSSSKITNQASIYLLLIEANSQDEIKLHLSQRPTSPKEWQALTISALKVEAPALGVAEPFDIEWPEGWP
jgi:hypothetical protein